MSKIATKTIAKPIILWALAMCMTACSGVSPSTAVNAPVAQNTTTQTTTAQDNKSNAKQALDEGVRLYQAGEYRQALPYFYTAKELGNIKAGRYIGLMYLHGQGVAQDDKTAFDEFLMASDKGDVTSQYWLAYCYENGIGTPVMMVQAWQWYTKSAYRGDHVSAPAMTALGRLYELGIGAKADRERAIIWYQKSASTGDNPSAQSAKDALIRLGVVSR